MASLRLLTAILALLLAAATAQYGAIEAPGLSPRYYLGGSGHLVDRQSGDCPSANEHTCLDVNAGSFCCPNTHYCIISNNTAACCFIGSTCGNLCDANHYECPGTTTISGTAISSSCCPRSCTSTSQYLCASAYGGQCCGYQSGCAANTQCVATSTSSSAASTGTSGSCPTSQSACASTLGGGCCSTGQSCTVVDNTNYCASNTALATRTGPNGILATGSSPSSGLSTGAKAGIGAGVAVGALVVISGFLWFCLAHRRRAKQAASVPAISQGSESGTKRPSNGRGGSDYFGPTAGHGPFTEPHDSAATSPGNHRGVPVSPQSPGDITVPVEIDSRDSRGHSNVTTPGAFEYVKAPGTTEDPVELP
ncbi:hypothetical protein BDZ45DRAFT_101685 [Acephala macrosclerotiorum]|nr:hypothetical protein BDZ45DRAFT_101685 [Acephala macrosclerotiorum]